MKILHQYVKNYRKEIILQIVFATLWVLTLLAIPRLMADIIDVGIAQKNMNYVVQTGVRMVGVTVLNIIFLLINLYFLTHANAGISRDLRRDLFEKVIHWSAHTRQGFSTATLITRNVNDVKQVSNFIDMSLRKIYTTSITIIGAVLLAFTLDARLAMFMLLIVPFILIIATHLTTRALPQYSKIRISIDRINRLFGQNITGIRVVKAFNKTEYEQKQFSLATEEAFDANVKAESTMMLLSPLVSLAANLLIIMILWVGADRVSAQTLQIGALVAIIEYVTMALDNVRSLSTIITIIPRSQVSVKRIEEILTTEEKVQMAVTSPIAEEGDETGIHFKRVTFLYPGSHLPAIQNFEGSIKKAHTTAIIGSTGSGKTTLLRLIMRDFDTSQGEICMEGRNVADLTSSDYQEMVTLIPQKTFLFSGTVRENIQIGRKEATDEDIWEVLSISQMADFFRKADGLDTFISQNATNLSGGQKQRIAIARGLIRDTDYYLFDDCFSALDFTTEKKIRQAIIKRLTGKTILVVAERVITVQDADQILVLENGQLMDAGTHEMLIQNSTVYQEIIASQKQEEVR